MTSNIEPVSTDEYGAEVHPSFVTIRANKVSSHPGAHLFDSEIEHQHYVVVTINSATRKRDLHRDWIHGTTTPTVEVAMSLAQWGAFVSSFGDGSGVPVTLTYLKGEGEIPGAPYEPRMAQSVAEVQTAGDRALAQIQEAAQAIVEGHEAKLGRREMGALINNLKHRVGNAGGNMAYAAQALNEHVENVVTKAKADIEAMVAQHAETLGLAEGAIGNPFELGSGYIEEGEPS